MFIFSPMCVQAWHGVTICCVPITRNHPRLSSRPDLLSPSPTLAPSTTRERRARSLSGASAPQLSLALEQVSFFVLCSLEQVSLFVLCSGAGFLLCSTVALISFCFHQARGDYVVYSEGVRKKSRARRVAPT